MSAKKRIGTVALAALAGAVSGGVFLGAAELVALLTVRDASPIVAVGSFVIDIVPRWAKELAIDLFGSNDKLFLLASLGLAVFVAAAVAGVLEWWRRWVGVALFALAGVAAVVATLTRTGASPFGFLPAAVGAVLGAVVLRLLIGRLHAWRDGTAKAEGVGVDRRRFLVLTSVAAAGALVAGVGSRLGSAATSSIAAVRSALKLPTPASRLKVPAGAELDVPGISPLFTPNADFYRVDTALTVPSVDPANWRLTIDGMVEKRVELSFQDLVDMRPAEYGVTLTCVSNEVGGNLVGNARWLGVPVRDILALARPRRGADMVLSRSVDGFTASTPLDALTDDGRDAILAIGMNGEPLPLEHGFPVRMVVPGLYGYVSATKWLTELKVTTFAADQAYWTPRGYSAKAPIKLSSRIDTPRVDKPLSAGPTKIAGVAWAQTVGIRTVEVRIDGGDWQQAKLSTPINADTWVQWSLDWDATPGSHTLAVRATDRAGRVQEQKRTPIAPNGSTGWQQTLVRVG
ncbi:molybdopterin-dependent oxidoreductase [Leifsonia sp. 1010]|uniref:molybdopterin-dependent oxidoreductase n=1 Tax=Leifsonia sp. 1010 TaxID=2817769 RepID=UPI00285703CA|nr:molybdopterin-dependent oxidoreductase [Leifsonia sp. 1010]MDR6610847.1 DMSO/TMAO reductase YedYZ molybdopterin-dependent catalytic subunit [Leifsonia sp. 1010]